MSTSGRLGAHLVCTKIPGFIELQSKYADRGVQFVGIALDDTDNVRRFAEEVGLNYPTMHGENRAMQLHKAFGDRIGGLRSRLW